MVPLSCAVPKHILWQVKKATVAYEVTVNHSGRCLHISAGHPGSRNDKTIVKTDELVMNLKDNKILQDVEYKLFKVSSTLMYHSCLNLSLISCYHFSETTVGWN